MRSLLAMLCILGVAVGTAAGELGPHLAPALGEPAAPNFESVAAADGSGLPAGSGTAGEGASLYVQQCSACHGLDGKLPGNALVGGVGSLASNRPQLTVGSYWPYATTLFDYINRAMPYGQEKSLKPDEVYAVTAYVLHLNGIVEEDQRLNAKTLPQIEMPNARGFSAAADYQPYRQEAHE